MFLKTREFVAVIGLTILFITQSAKADEGALTKTVALQQAQIQQLQKQIEKLQILVGSLEENSKLKLEKTELPNLATKGDLQPLALKTDLANLLPCGRQVRIATSSGQWYLTSSPDDIVRATKIDTPSARQTMFIICP
ncbi:MAG: hypothetical protein EOP04_04090 [Proteobacteria bacterium]|nr:MAG: hypothetical protein EOP04_04090 [Pseudomonadota bacterium]